MRRNAPWIIIFYSLGVLAASCLHSHVEAMKFFIDHHFHSGTPYHCIQPAVYGSPDGSHFWVEDDGLPREARRFIISRDYPNPNEAEAAKLRICALNGRTE